MELADKIRELAKLEGVEDSELILDEVYSFLKEHEGHGSYGITMRYSPDSTVESMILQCTANDILYPYQCPHQNSDVAVEFSFSIIYQKNITKEVGLQKLRREGKIDYQGNKI